MARGRGGAYGVMEFRLLGSVEARAAGDRVDLGPRKARFVLAVLALEVNHAVGMARLIELTWPESPPRTAEHAVRVFVSHLRTAFAAVPDSAAAIERQGSGYLLRCDPGRIDAHRFRSLVREARRQDDDGAMVALLDEALGLWSGVALDGCAEPRVRELLCGGLEEARLTAVEDWLDARLRLGQHRAALDELTGLVGRHPLRERLVGQLMLALYRDGRTADALAVFRAARERWATQLGLDPSPRLRQLETAVLRGDPALAAPATRPAPAGTDVRALDSDSSAADVWAPGSGSSAADVRATGSSAADARATGSSAADARAPASVPAVETPRALRILLVDDHPLFRAGLRVALETDPGIGAVVEAGDADSAIRQAAAGPPDVVVMDLDLPDRSGVEATRLLRRAHPDLPILIMTMSAADGHIVDALQAGAHGYILKAAGRDEVLHAIRSVFRGSAVFSAGVAARLAAMVPRAGV